MKKIIILLAALIVTGCMPRRYAYKVTFVNGEVEYFELNYKPAKNAKSIQYEGDEIIGVKSIERL